MLARPTTTVTIKRAPTGNDDFLDTYQGDDPQTWVTVADNVPASMLEQAPVVTDEQTGEPNTIRYFIGRVSADVDVRPQDRVYDANNLEYQVDFVSAQQSFAFTPDTRMNLRLLNYL